jgi:SpoVK/Ycf46/Vps4 family AAA+-type ATPase
MTPGDELRSLIRAGWRLLALETFEEERGLTLLERVAEAVERPCVPWSVAMGLGGSEHGRGSLDAGLQAIEQHADPAIFAILDAHRVLDDSIAVRRLRDLLPSLATRKQCVILVGPAIELPLELVREVGRIQLPLPAAPEMDKIFRRVAEQMKIAVDEEMLGHAVRGALGLTGSEATRMLRRALRQTKALDEQAVVEIVRDKRHALRRTPALSFHDDATGLADVGGLGELKRWLADRRRAFTDDARRFGVPIPRGLLLLGVQGCGKSLSAKAVAREWHFPLLRLDLAAAFGGGGQRPEAVLREAIQVAESVAPAVLWIDEIEKGFASSEHDATATRVLGSFLTWLSEKKSPVFVVATANDVAGLPPELLRRGRFDDLFFVDLPTQAERTEIISIHLAKHGRDPLQFDLEQLAIASERLSGAELEQVVTAALYAAFSASRDLTDPDLLRAIDETIPIYETYEERIKELRDWSRGRARPASLDAKIVDFFQSAPTG